MTGPGHPSRKPPGGPTLLRLKPAIAAPVLVSIAAVAFAALQTPWWLLALPFVLLASACAAPNLNLANGCAAYVSMAIGGALSLIHEPSGRAIWAGTLASFLGSALEKLLTAEVVEDLQQPPAPPQVPLGAGEQDREQ